MFQNRSSVIVVWRSGLTTELSHSRATRRDQSQQCDVVSHDQSECASDCWLQRLVSYHLHSSRQLGNNLPACAGLFESVSSFAPAGLRVSIPNIDCRIRRFTL